MIYVQSLCVLLIWILSQPNNFVYGMYNFHSSYFPQYASSPFDPYNWPIPGPPLGNMNLPGLPLGNMNLPGPPLGNMNLPGPPLGNMHLGKPMNLLNTFPGSNLPFTFPSGANLFPSQPLSNHNVPFPTQPLSNHNVMFETSQPSRTTLRKYPLYDRPVDLLSTSLATKPLSNRESLFDHSRPSHSNLGYVFPERQPNLGYTFPENQPNLGYIIPENQPNLGYIFPENRPNLGYISPENQQLFKPSPILSVPELSHGSFSMQGKKGFQEDRLIYNNMKGLYAVFDGHRGPQASDFAADNMEKMIDIALIHSPYDVEKALRTAYLEADASFSQHGINSGTTAVTAMIKNNDLYVANVGDSRAVLCCTGSLGLDMSKDHNNLILEERIRTNGGFQQVTRSIGNPDLKIYGMIAVPTIEQINLSTLLPRGRKFLILASDGIWGVLTSQQAVDIVHNLFETGHNVQAAAEKLAQAAFNNGSGDNISVVIVMLD